MSDFTRNCPDCNKVLTYNNKPNLIRATKKHSKCKSCTFKGHIVSDEIRKKISDKQKGKNIGPPSKQHRINISLAKGGNGILDNIYPGWRSWTKRALERTSFCEWCYSEDDLQVHHIIPKAKFPQYHDADWNARVMCKKCHITCHKQGGY